MNEIVNKKRIVESKTETRHPLTKEITVECKITETELPYCGNCNKIVFDASQKYCCWCGMKFGGESDVSKTI